MKRISLLLVVGLLSCGGGGGGGGSDTASVIPSFAGVWDAVVQLTHDDCNLDSQDAQLTDVQTISQNGTEITVTGQDDGDVETGAVDGDDSFTTTQTKQISEGCSGTGTTHYDNLHGNQADVTFVFNLDCGEARRCTIEYGTGSATRR